MLRPWRLVLLSAVGLLIPAGHAMAAAPPPYRPVYPLSVTTSHFVVHYTSDTAKVEHVTQLQAGDVAGMAELAYESEVTNWTLPAPPSDVLVDGDARIDIYVTDLTTYGIASATVGDAPGLSTTGSIDLDYLTGLQPSVIADSLLNVIELGIWSADESWVFNASGIWAGKKVTSYPDASPFGDPAVSLDCDYLGINTANCSSDPSADIGWARWPFFEYLSERYGPAFLADVFAAGAATGSTSTPVATALDTALVAKNATLGSVFTEWAVAEMRGDWTAAPLVGQKPTPVANVVTGVISGSLGSKTVSVNHLAAKYMTFQRGNGKNATPCYTADLTVTVQLPSGVAAQPTFWWSAASSDGTTAAPVALSVSGGSATATVPWDTCDWGLTPPKGWLVLPNPTTSADGANFTVSSSLAVHLGSLTTATPPPPQATVHGAVVPAATTDDAPDLDVFGPDLIHVGANAKELRLIVQSSGPGQVSAALGQTALGTVSLRAGNNDVRFALPASVLKRLRVSAGASLNILTLTSLSPEGSAGLSMQRRVLVDAAKVKAKARPKSKAKPKKQQPAGKRH